MRLTDKVHAIVGARLSAGDWAIDATAGNGHDTLFLSRTVGPTGRIFAFDIQAQALRNTANLLAAHASNVSLIHAGHESMCAHLPKEAAGRIGAVLFNLGYLPRGDKRIVTTPATTLVALQAACAVLAPQGIMTILLYRGHAEGAQEAAAIEAWTAALPVDWCCARIEADTDTRHTAPVLLVVTRVDARPTPV